ncbi:MAG: family 43 glycosylhydrolase [Acidimicrobiia bacterium]|nr:family 43 glycosylhydrolase [Acidimicrobiia bacterium]
MVRLRRTMMMATALVGLASLLLGCTPATPLGRPALRQTPNATRVFDNADSAVLVADGKTYLFGSTNNKRLPVRQISSFSTSLADSQRAWASNPVDAMSLRPAWVDPGEAEIWAPSVVRIGTRYVVYFAAHNRAATTDEANDQCIGRAFATNPMGPYAPEASPIYCGIAAEGAGQGLPASNRFGRGALDPEVFRSPDGRLYMVVALSRTAGNIGVVGLRSDGTMMGTSNAAPAVLASQSLPYHDGSDDGTRDNSFLENPSMIYEPQTRTYLLFYSAGHWFTDRYLTGFARCASPTGPCTLDNRGPFLKSGNGRTGPGGLTVFKDANGALKVAYASWQAGFENQVGSVGQYKRQTHWAQLVVTATSDPAAQSVSLR